MNTFAITNALLADGSGRPSYCADVVISGDRICRVASHGSLNLTGINKRDAAGMILAPGFIDAHGHSDMSLPAAPEAFSSISQGITTEVAGNCGLSLFPVASEEVREHLQILYSRYGVKITWSTLAEYARELEKREPSINLVLLCGHNTLKASVCGYSSGNAGDLPANREKMSSLLRQALSEGAAGLSTGLLYMPGRTSSQEELLALMKVLKETGKIYATHLRNEGDTLEEALQEAVFLASHGSGKLQVSHLKTALPRNWHKLPEVFRMMEEAQTRGLRVTADRYPWTFSQTSLSIILPPPYDVMTDRAIRDALQKDPQECRRLAEFLNGSGRDWRRVILACTGVVSMKKYCGRTLQSLQEELHSPPGEIVIRLLAEDAPGTMGAFGGMSEENLARILQKDYVCCGTDESARPADDSIGRSHPRGFGSMPGFFRKLTSAGFTPEQAVARMTSLPAKIFSIPGRGMIREGYFADLVLFDPDKFLSRADFASPHTPAEGIHAVYVNGREHGRAGRFLKIPDSGLSAVPDQSSRI